MLGISLLPVSLETGTPVSSLVFIDPHTLKETHPHIDAYVHRVKNKSFSFNQIKVIYAYFEGCQHYKDVLGKPTRLPSLPSKPSRRSSLAP